MKRALCIVILRPTHEIAEFYNRFSNYTVFFILDDMDFDCSPFRAKYSSIKFVQIPNDLCAHRGYKASSYMPTSSLQFNEIIAWDRAIYYFCRIDFHFDQVWFLEEDVFIYGQETIENVDKTYPESDLLCRDMTPEPKEGEWRWFWPCVSIHFRGPYYRSMVCAVRISRDMLQKLADYIETYRSMTFIEALLPSIASHYGLKIDTPREFAKIEWRHDWAGESLSRTDIVHPIKNHMIQAEERLRIV